MTQKLFRYVLAMCVALGVSATLTGCIDDDLTGNREADTEDYAIAFDISLDAGNATRANGDKMEVGDPIDSEVDIAGTNHDFRILFFDTNDKFLFEPAQKSEYYIATADDYGYTTDDDNNNPNAPDLVQTNRWRVKIPISVLREKGVLETMENEGFKIAVLANWPKNPLAFNIGDPISKLSHYCADTEYSGKYTYLTNEENKDKWGASINWVKNNHSSADEAENFIRNEKYEGAPFDYNKPGEVMEDVTQREYNYKHIWRIWNFRGEAANIDEKTNTGYLYYQGADDYRAKWKDINNAWCKDLSVERWQSSRFYHGYKYTDKDTYDDQYQKFALDFQGNGINYSENEGLSLPKFSEEITIKDITTDLYDNNHIARNNVLHFKAFADGTLNIKAATGSNTQGDNVVLGVQIEASDKGSSSKGTGKQYRINNLLHLGNTTNDDKGILTLSKAVTVELNPIDIYIYAINGTAQIHEIEFIENTYLYDTDRRGRLPGESEEFKQLIPMYGIQEFTPIGKFLIPGQTLNLSESGDAKITYKGDKVYLLRSLAKVELFMPENWNPTHIVMRSMNRTNRCEPVDVSTPTNELWKNVDQEIQNIASQGVFYDANNNKTNGETKMKWFYGAWPENENTATDCPHIYNCRIQRTDYARILKTKLQPRTGYTRYVLYMPEKNIDDPTNVKTDGADWSSNPKVAHIELRFNSTNDDLNLEDNDCYRIYFATTQQYKSVPDPKSDPSTYEKNLTKSNNGHYPIMRNHIYRFTLSGDPNTFAEKSKIEVTLDVHPYGTYWLDPEFGL